MSDTSQTPGTPRVERHHADVVVIGGGGAGLAAAIEAASAGAEVALIEKNDSLGGTTALAVGSFTASGTRLQQRNGIVDDLDEHFEDMGAFAGDLVDRDNLELRRLYVERSGPTLEWLRELGVVFFGPMEEPPHRRARMHNILPGSRAYIRRLHRAARRLGVRITTGITAERLLVGDNGVEGVRCRGPHGAWEITASKGVILAAGDFSASRELKTEQMGELAAGVDAVNATSTGDGIRLGRDAGGVILNGDLALGPEMRFAPSAKPRWPQRIPAYRWIAIAMSAAVRVLPAFIMRRIIMAFATSYLAPTPKIFGLGALLVTADGDRVPDASGDPGTALARQPGATGWIVLDRAAAERLTRPNHYISTAPGVAYAYLDDYRASRKDLVHEADSLAGLASSIGVQIERLHAAVADAAGERGTDEFAGPYTALGPVRSWIVLTEGGLAVDTSCRVLDADGRPVPGLFAAGSNGQGGLLLEGHGNHIGWAFVSGRIAGRNAARDQDRHATEAR